MATTGRPPRGGTSKEKIAASGRPGGWWLMVVDRQVDAGAVASDEERLVPTGGSSTITR